MWEIVLVSGLLGLLCGYVGKHLVCYLHNFSSNSGERVVCKFDNNTRLVCILNAVMFMLLGYADKGVLTFILCYVLFLNAVSDYLYRETLTLLNYIGCVLYFVIICNSVGFNLLELWGTGWGYSLIGAGILLVLGLLAGTKYLGAGDWDVLAIILLTLGYFKLFIVVFIASVVGILYYGIKLRKSEDKTIPFASCLFVGGLVVVLYLSFI